MEQMKVRMKMTMREETAICLTLVLVMRDMPRTELMRLQATRMGTIH